MGQTQSNQKTDQQLYAEYINKQQELIRQQQHQINSLYKYNMTMSQEAPSNIRLETRHNDNNHNNHNQNNSYKALPSGKLDPYKILNISKNYTEKELKKAYLKTAMRAHPDRGGSEDEFQKVSIAYALLEKTLKNKEDQRQHDELKKQSEQDISLQHSKPVRNMNMTDNFDINVFNKIYTENKIEDVFDSGYSSWMKNNSVSQEDNPKMFQSGFNKDMFNSEFDRYKRDNTSNNGALVKYAEPETRISSSTQDSLMVLGRGKITDFSGETNGFQFTDYKKAFTDGSTMIDINSVSLDSRAGSMNSIKKQRSNISYNMSDEDIRKVKEREILEQRNERERIKRLQLNDERHGEAYERIHGLLLR